MVGDWKDAEIVPIPKKGDLKHCDNWRGISLLDVVGKVFCKDFAGAAAGGVREGVTRVTVWVPEGERVY